MRYNQDEPLRRYRLSMRGGHAFLVLVHETSAKDLRAALVGKRYRTFLFLDRQNNVLDNSVDTEDILAIESMGSETLILNELYKAKQAATAKAESVRVGQTAKR